MFKEAGGLDSMSNTYVREIGSGCKVMNIYYVEEGSLIQRMN